MLLIGRGRLLPVITLGVLGSVVLQLLFEFGPLWLVALAVPAVLYGPYWAALVSTLGLGGLLAAGSAWTGRARRGRWPRRWCWPRLCWPRAPA